MTQNDEIVRLKAELFDLQAEYGKLRLLIEQKLKQLNILLVESRKDK